MLNKIKIPQINPLECLLFIFAFIFSFWLMFSTFSYEKGVIQIGAKAWSDFASHIPVIRSFSFGSNFPPEYALFPGEPMRFHFLFYALVGLLEKIGIPLNYALNIPSAIGFLGLLVMIYIFAKQIFNSISVGIISVILFLFNGSLSFIEFFKTHPLSITAINEIISNKVFPSFGPYDGKTVAAFWNLNIYTNQRHLGLSYGLSLLLIYILINPIFSRNHMHDRPIKMPKMLKWFLGEKIDFSSKFLLKNVLLGSLLGSFFYLHLGVFTFTIIIIGVLALLFRQLRFPTIIIFIIGFIFSFPQYLYQSNHTSTFSFLVKPGYLIDINKLSFISFTDYWFMNLGIPLVLLSCGFVFAPVKLKKIFLAFFSLFIIGNLFQFSPEIAGNHKFFNFFMICGVTFASYFLTKLWKKNIAVKSIVVVAIFFSVLSGIIDFFPIYNDSKITLADYPINPDVKWIKDNTPKDSVFLNTQYLYNPASIAGRKIFLGWPYFAWSAGYDTDERDRIRRSLLNSNNLTQFCNDSRKYKINYVEINNHDEYDYPINNLFFEENFPRAYGTRENLISIYDVNMSCDRKGS
ncbi:MAG: hypothetical protein AAB521_04995 [Patescibacteria group bacterium]